MKWIYGKHDWVTLERGEENCYLMTNNLGGYSSLTMTGAVSRNDHALLMACVQAPNHRYNLVHRVREEVQFCQNDSDQDNAGQDDASQDNVGKDDASQDVVGQIDSGQDDGSYIISSQEFAEGHKEEGFRFLSSFTYEDTPVWKYHVKGVEIKKEAGLQPGTNTVALRYEIVNRSQAECRLCVTPFFQFVPKGSDMDAQQMIRRTDHQITAYKMTKDGLAAKTLVGTAARATVAVDKAAGDGKADRSVQAEEALSLFFRTNGTVTDIQQITEHYHYRHDICDGRRESGTAKSSCQFSLTVGPGEKKVLEIIFEMQESSESAQEIIGSIKKHRFELVNRAGLTSEIGKMMVKSADQFISERASTGGLTILAGYPFFEDWGRDTMIALPGLCITTGQYDVAKQILRTFAIYERNGLMPNLFPEGGNEPMYNTADAALLFVNCIYLYYKATGDGEFVKEVYPVLENIMNGYQNGTDFGIRMDEDGLIQAGEGLDQVTWMDVRVGEILPTPRHGKPVEINAYWYNALCIMDIFSKLLGKGNGTGKYSKLAKKVKTTFEEMFWMEEKGCLKDVISGTFADEQIRCSQIWAVSMPFTMLSREKEKQMVETLFEKLYTPYGLRTLEEADPQFHPCYAGPMEERDMAYHQGTVWTFPLGGYYIAYLKVHDYSEEAKNTVREQLEVMESAMREGCIGQLPEVYDGMTPTVSKGCFAQAWSVGELLCVYEKLEPEK